MNKAFFLLALLFSAIVVQAQNIRLSGRIQNSTNQPVPDATISVDPPGDGVISDQLGQFSIDLQPHRKYRLIIRHVAYRSIDTVVQVDDRDLSIVFEMVTSDNLLEGVEVVDSLIGQSPRQNVIQVDPKSAGNLPSPFNDFSRVLITLPGVTSNNELSTTYSVRGGNFDENLVYVNDIPIYRPFLANSGRQEGLSFVNPDLVKNIGFSPGGWEAKYGDKLSSSLNIEYKEPEKFEGSVSGGLLGGSGFAGGSINSNRTKYLIGFRHRDSQYLLNTLEVDGEYFPRYTDVQSMLTFDLTPDRSNYQNRTKLNWLVSYGRNRYLTKPTSQLTEFGSVSKNLRLETAFIGRELLEYDTYQSGIRLSHWFSHKLKSHLIASWVYTSEEENFDVEGGYRLCDVDNSPGSGTFDDCVVTRGIGTQYDYGRNNLDAYIATVENRHELIVGNNGLLELGAGITLQHIEDEINEYAFIDSADYISLTHRTFNSLELNNAHYFGYLQYHLYSKDSLQELNIGVRSNHWTQTDQLLISPRLLYRIKPNWRVPTHFNLSMGRYAQHPFYRELRDFGGALNENISAQKSDHLIIGMDRYMTMWGRPFLFTVQSYYKKLTDIIPYDVDNLRLRYFASNNASGHATGIDFRINGEFIKGTQSWFSLGLLQTREDIKGDARNSIRRPSDQRMNVGVYFEDHMPTDPTVRVYLNLTFGSGFPFGPPGNAQLRNIFSGDEYYRADIGLSKSFEFTGPSVPERLWLRLEVLNALGADNTLSYTWIEDVNGTSFAIPNSLTARFVNIRISVDF